VPDDVVVIGFDDGPLAECTSPPLITVHHPVERIAAVATRALMDGTRHHGWRVVEPASLVVRRAHWRPVGPASALLPAVRRSPALSDVDPGASRSCRG
jgi:Periplasmic binding protein-like domain